ncbi:MAG: L-threonylcarbamoyladenylate synthase [Chloroflexota bacterium]|nr:threonylcarbamoyl-AMP synthase [Chloroflexota bacterium]MBI5704979.1 threonylcarbamoyl-AMP synthase [Chloroflexota bacterium]
MYSVKTQTFTLDPNNPDPAVIAQAAERLRADGLVAFPTETVYGLGANALSPVAVGRIFEVKKRPFYDPLIVHLARLSQIEQVARDVPPLAYELAQIYWPGPLTLVLKKSPQVAANVSAGLETVAVRMPNHRIPLALVETSGLPIAAPSANLFTRPSPTSARHVLEDLNGHVDVILDGGDCPIGLESTILDLTASPPTVLRHGGLALDLLRQQIPDLQIARRYVKEDEGLPISAPGMLVKHYSPKSPLLLFTGQTDAALPRLRDLASVLAKQGYRVSVMTTTEDARHFTDLNLEIADLGSATDLPQIGRRLFDQMRRLDALRVDVILVRAPAQEGLGLTIWDRLFRAAEGQVFDLDMPLDVEEIAQLLESRKSA